MLLPLGNTGVPNTASGRIKTPAVNVQRMREPRPASTSLGRPRTSFTRLLLQAVCELAQRHPNQTSHAERKRTSVRLFPDPHHHPEARVADADAFLRRDSVLRGSSLEQNERQRQRGRAPIQKGARQIDVSEKLVRDRLDRSARLARSTEVLADTGFLPARARSLRCRPELPARLAADARPRAAGRRPAARVVRSAPQVASHRADPLHAGTRSAVCPRWPAAWRWIERPMAFRGAAKSRRTFLSQVSTLR